MKMHKRNILYIFCFAGVILLLLLLKLPSFLAPLYFIDEGIYAAIAHFMSDGYVLYKNVFDNKTPSIYYLFLLSRHFFSYSIIPLKIFVAACSLGTLLLEYRIVTKWFFAYKRYFILIALVGFVLLNGIEDNLVNAEVIFAFFSLASIVFLYRFNKEKSIQAYILAGILMGVGITFKATAAFDMIAFVFVYILFSAADYANTKEKKELLINIFHLCIYGIFAALPMAMYLVYFAHIGTLHGFVQSAFLSSTSYVSVYNNNYFGVNTSILNVIGVILGIGGISIWYWIHADKRNIEHKAIAFIGIWVMCVLYAALISGRPYTHYLLQIAVPVSILFALIVYTKRIALLILFVIAFCIFIMYFYRNSTNKIPFQNISQFIVSPVYSYGKEYGYYFGLVSKKTYEYNFQINEYRLDAGNLQTLITYTKNLPPKKNSDLFIWGNIPWVYATTNLHPVCGYSFNYYIDQADIDKLQYIMQCLEKKPPAYIIDDKSRYAFDDLYTFEKEHYILKNTFFKGITRMYVLK